MRIIMIAFLAVLLIGLSLSYGAKAASSAAVVGTNPPPGAVCKVQFRRDMLGCASNLSVGPTVDNVNGAQISETGRLAKIDPEWIVLERQHDHLWIPRQNVLLLQIEK